MSFQWNQQASEQAAQEPDSFELMPEGTYRVMINKVDDKETRAGTGKYLAFEFEVVEGRQSGRRVWENINYQNPNPKAEAIAWRTLNDISKALFGQVKQAGLSDFESKILVIVTKNEKWNDKMQTRVKKFLPDGAHKEKPKSTTPTVSSEDVPF